MDSEAVRYEIMTFLQTLNEKIAQYKMRTLLKVNINYDIIIVFNKLKS